MIFNQTGHGDTETRSIALGSLRASVACRSEERLMEIPL